MPFVHANDTAMGDLGYERREEDFYPTPAWVTYAFLKAINASPLKDILTLPAWECACGEGHISEVLRENQIAVTSTDLIDRGYSHGRGGVDFLAQTKPPVPSASLIITNPPYGDLAEEFVKHALKLTKPDLGAVAMLMRHEWDCAVGRKDIFSEHPAFMARVILTSRPRWIEGSKGSPRHNYSWYVWDWYRPVEKPIILYGHKDKGFE